MAQRRRTCVKCGGPMAEGPQTASVTVGLRTFCADVHGAKCRKFKCRDVYYDGADLEALDVLIAKWLATRGFNAGQEFRFMRKAVGFRAVDLAALLGVTPETISHWEVGKHKPDMCTRQTLGALVLDHVEQKTATADRLRALRRPPTSRRVGIDIRGRHT